MKDQFFGKPFLNSLAMLLGAFVLAIPAYVYDFGWVVLLGMACVFVVLTAWNPVLALGGVFLELISHPHGYLFSTEVPIHLSLRMVIFASFFLGYTVYLIRHKSLPTCSQFSIALLLPLGLAITIGFLRGFFLQDGMTAFQDGNAYLYLLYAIPICSHVWNSSSRRLFLQILSAGVVWNILLSLGILYVFSHFSEAFLYEAYKFLRDIRLAEITNIGSGVYRVFIQSQFFTFAFGLLLIPYWFQQKNAGIVHQMLLLSGIVSVILLSLSRSFWIGLFAGCVVMGILLLKERYALRQWGRFTGIVLCALVLGVLSILVVSLFPFPTQKIGGDDLSRALRTRAQTDVAISSRWMLFDPMIDTIQQHPLLGNGFGASVTFISDDPRVRELHPDGRWTTYTMEWGWLELWLKMGVLGPLAFLWMLVLLVYRFLSQQKTDHTWISFGLVGGLVFLFATHVFSPYLNHPIGLGFLLFSLVFLPDAQDQPQHKFAQSMMHIPQQIPVQTSAFSLRVEE